MNYYEVLGLDINCDICEIKSAYRKLVRKYHPDINPDGIKMFKLISDAYETLSDAEKRKRYDILNNINKKNDTNNSYSTKENTLKSKSTSAKSTNKNKEKKYEKIFKNIFDNKQNNEPIKGDDITADVSISVADSIHGAQRTVNIMHSEICPRCKGRKFINGSKCSVCNGTGEFTQQKRIKVTIPPNTINNTKLRIKNEGCTGKFGGVNGDLYLIVHVRGNSKISYDGLNVLYTVPITPYEAVLGGQITIPTYNGFVKLTIPANTGSGQKFRLKNEGLTKSGKTGDMIVTLSIEIPKYLSDDEVKLYEKLKELSTQNPRENLLND